jgi:hypothetical protein
MFLTRRALVDRLVADLATGVIGSVAFVVPSHVWWTLPLYDVAITTARRGWTLGIAAATYWFVTRARTAGEHAVAGPVLRRGCRDRLEGGRVGWPGAGLSGAWERAAKRLVALAMAESLPAPKGTTDRLAAGLAAAFSQVQEPRAG